MLPDLPVDACYYGGQTYIAGRISSQALLAFSYMYFLLPIRLAPIRPPPRHVPQLYIRNQHVTLEFVLPFVLTCVPYEK